MRQTFSFYSQKKFTLILLHHRISDFVNDYSIEWTVNVPSIWFRHEKRRLIFRNYWILFWEIDNRNWNEDTLARNKHDRALQKFEAYVVQSNNNSGSIWMSRAVPCYVGDGTCVEFVEQHRPCYIMSSFLSLNLWLRRWKENRNRHDSSLARISCFISMNGSIAFLCFQRKMNFLCRGSWVGIMGAYCETCIILRLKLLLLELSVQ